MRPENLRPHITASLAWERSLSDIRPWSPSIGLVLQPVTINIIMLHFACTMRK
jgi:hypothetical protein